MDVSNVPPHRTRAVCGVQLEAGGYTITFVLGNLCPLLRTRLSCQVYVAMCFTGHKFGAFHLANREVDQGLDQTFLDVCSVW